MPEKFTLDEIILQLRTQWDVVAQWPYDDGGPRHWAKVDVKYGFFPGQVPFGPLYASPEALGYQPMTDSQASLAREAFELWDDLIAINLTETTDWSDVDISFAYSDYTAGGDSYTDVDDGDIGSAEIWLNTSRHDVQEGTLNYGTGFGNVYLHEIGHSLGLSHPGSYNHSATYADDAEYAQDTKQFTLMSYFNAGADDSAADHGADPSNEGRPFTASTPLLHDIAAIQAIYGADMTTRTGDTVYGFNSNAGRGAFDFTQNTHPIIAIWDAGGNDTLDASGFSDFQTIDLHVNQPGEEDPVFSSVGGLSLNVAIAYNVLIENAIGGSGTDIITGNSAANRLEGRGGGDVLDGRAGADVMIGGQGDDTYSVDTVEHYDPVTQTYYFGSDQVIEAPNQGYDAVASTVSYALPDNVEELRLVVASLNGYGNGLDNRLYGTVGAEHLEGLAGNDMLDGRAGADTMIGSQGDDTYYVDTVEHYDPVTQTYYFGSDRVIENADEGSDMVISTVTYTLPDNVERLTLGGFDNIDGYGNNLDNELIGNPGANRLEGLAGDDTYVMNHSGDQVIEASAAGTDLVRSSISFALGANVENLTLTGSAGISGTGNSLANTIIGNSGANILNGGVGNDTLNGGAGNDRISGGAGNDTINGGLGTDTLTGGKGSDIFFFNSALSKFEIDTITDFSVPDDTIQLENAVFTELAPFGGTLSAGAFFIGAAAHDRDDHIIYDSSTGSLMYDADGNGSGQARTFAVLTTGLPLTHDDFFIV